jgi:hypothetical protein
MSTQALRRGLTLRPDREERVERGRKSGQSAQEFSAAMGTSSAAATVAVGTALPPEEVGPPPA